MGLEFTKRVRFLIRQLAGKAHEREVRRHLEGLARSFHDWQQGTKDTWDLEDEIYQFVKGPSRKLASRYGTNGTQHLVVAYAIVNGILRDDEVPAEVRSALAPAIEFSKRHSAETGRTDDDEPSDSSSERA